MKDPSRDVCAIGRCKSIPDMTCWSVPICQPHWNQCCEEMPGGSSLAWLHKKVRVEFRSTLPPVEAGAPIKAPASKPKAVRISAPPAKPKAVRVSPPPVRRAVRISTTSKVQE